jgi:hypothetical protein
MNKQLPNVFTGTGEAAGFLFELLEISPTAYAYSVCIDDRVHHFEVFKRKTTPICLDFENRIFSETMTRDVYPKAKDFGKWAWTYNDYKKAMDKFKSLEVVE